MRVLLIGGTGFIGSWIVRQLAGAGHELRVFHRGLTNKGLPAEATELLGERKELPRFGASLRDWSPDIVLDTCAYDREDVVQLHRALGDLPCTIALLSSMDVYRAYGIFCRLESGPPIAEPFAEDAAFRTVLYPYREETQIPEELKYRYDKIPAEQFLLRESGRRALILRLGKVYGAGDPQRHVANYLETLEGPIRWSETKANWRWSRVYVENAAAAVAEIITRGIATNSIYNIADEPALTEREWLTAIARIRGAKVRLTLVEQCEADSDYNWEQHLVANLTRLREALPGKSFVGLEESLRRTLGLAP